MDWPEFESEIERWDLGFTGEVPWVEFEVVVDGDGFLA
jgi:hypothetical protein